MKKIGREVGLLLVLAAVLFGPTLMAGQGRAAQPRAGGLPDLVGALKATPGCLGVETAQTSSGKQVIFAWFENKKAALNWYYSDMHQGVVSQFFPGAPPSRKPLADVTDADGPVMAIASLTMAKPQAGVNASPFSQIAIELYRPLPGGIELGGRFAPAALKVPGLQVIPARTPPAAPEDTIVPSAQMGRPLTEKGLGDYERVLEIQAPIFKTLGDHPKGELLFGLAEGYSRLGNGEKARMYFDRLIKDAPASGQAPKAQAWLSTGSLPKNEGLGCVGCHK